MKLRAKVYAINPMWARNADVRRRDSHVHNQYGNYSNIQHDNEQCCDQDIFNSTVSAAKEEREPQKDRYNRK